MAGNQAVSRSVLCNIIKKCHKIMKAAWIAAISAALLITSCAPAKNGKSVTARRINKVKEQQAAAQVGGHNIEVSLRGAGFSTRLRLLVGNAMDTYDRKQLNHVYERGVSGRPSSWLNPNREHLYQVTPYPPYEGNKEQTCRKAKIKGLVNGKTETVNTAACRSKNGQWQVQEER
jgi:surface antigen